jgi:hypothetical protein
MNMGKMLKRGGKNHYGHQFWTLHIPDDCIMKGLEVGVVADDRGMSIAGELITWKTLEKARAEMDEMP